LKTLGILLGAALVGAASGWIAAYGVYRNALHRIELLTPVVVVDATKTLEALNVKSTPEEIATVLEKVKNQAEKLKQAGFIVLKPNTVMAAPDEVVIKMD
jgi:SepF-like predicted cell division protein (DUF552 family)